jgi:hypothetical protein
MCHPAAMLGTHRGPIAFRDHSLDRTDHPDDISSRGSPMSKNGQYHTEAQTRSLTGVQIVGTGSYVPDDVITNRDPQNSHGFDPE